MKRCTLIVLFLAIIFYACDKKEETHPIVLTLGAEATSGSTVILKANVLAIGSIKVLDYGFLINDGSFSERKFSMNRNISPGVYELEATGLSGRNIARAYILNEKGTAYGEPIEFTMPDPLVSSVSPSAGKAGDHVVIYGNNFPSEKERIQVKFNDAQAKIIELHPDKIKVEVPESAYHYYYNSNIQIHLLFTGIYNTSTLYFQLLPSLFDFEPKSGTIGTKVSITGNYLYYQNLRVYFNDIESYAYAINNNMLEALIPPGITSENVKIKVLASGVSHEFSEEFKIVAPVINDFSPKSGLPGTTVTITGSNFGNFGGNILSFGEDFVDVYFIDHNQIQFVVPQGISVGEYSIKINTGIHETSSTSKFSVVDPEISGFFPESAVQGSTITITGKNLTNEYSATNVRFGTFTSHNFTGNSDAITAEVPYGVDPGKMKISVTTAGKTATSDSDFTVIEPTITEISPQSGTPGTKVTITGTGFSTDPYYTTVYFAHSGVSVLTTTKTTIEVLVPSNLGPGTVYFYISVHGRYIETDKRFTIL